jgi:transposase
LLPTDLPPRTTVYRWFALWRDTGLFESMNHLETSRNLAFRPGS